MSAAPPGIAGFDASVARDRTHVVVRLEDQLVVGRAGAVRRVLGNELSVVPSTGSAIIDMGEVTELDAAGLAAVTAPAFAAGRRGCRVAVLPPTSGPARRFAETVGILPIGVG